MAIPLKFEAAKTAWVTQVKDFGQLFLLTPVFPLMGAVLGYTFGRQTSETAKETKAAATGDLCAEPGPWPTI